MLNYEVPPAVLSPLVPRGTTLDLWQGRALVSVVGFRFLGTRVLGVPVPLHRDFDEVNLRFYVRSETATGEVRRAVVFVRELVPRWAVAAVARLAYNEPYDAVPMRSSVPPTLVPAPGRLEYAWRSGGRWNRVAAETVGEPALPPSTAKRRSSRSTTGATRGSVTAARWSTRSAIRGGACGPRVTRCSMRTWRDCTARSSPTRSRAHRRPRSSPRDRR